MASVVVVGGGVAGLTCAWRLLRSGHDVEVLEREDEPGGRVRSETRDGLVIERGARRVARGDRNLHVVASRLGLAHRLRPRQRAARARLRQGRFEPLDAGPPLGLLRAHGLSAGARGRAARLAFELWRLRAQLDPLHPECAAALDGPESAEALRTPLGDELFFRRVAPALDRVCRAAPESVSRAFALLALRRAASDGPALRLDGGLGRLTDALAERVPVRLGCSVHTVETQTDGARVRYRARGRESSLIADAAVVAVPGAAVAEICPKLAPAERGFFEGVRYARSLSVHLWLDAAPRELPIAELYFPRSEGIELVRATLDPAPRGAGLLCATLDAAATGRLWQAPDAAVRAAVLDALARTPVGRLAPSDGAVQRWSSGVPLFAPGQLRRLAGFLGRAERSPRLAFAGDYLVGPSVEGALTSGMRAASEIARSL